MIIVCRDVCKFIMVVVEDGVFGDWMMMEIIYIGVVVRFWIVKFIEVFELILDELELLCEGVFSVLESNIFL